VFVTVSTAPRQRLAPLPTDRAVAMRPGDFDTLLDALAYAAEAGTGAGFHDGRGRLSRTLSWAELQAQARTAGGHLAGLGLARGDRVGIIAETRPDFLIAFFACRFAALTPVPLPATVHLGGHRHYVDMLGRMLASADARCALASEAFTEFLTEAAGAESALFRGTLDQLAERPSAALPAPPTPDELAYVQYTSGSTRFPRGAMLTERATLRNALGIIRDGLALTPEDRFFSWLPLYHDMGLVGKMIVPIASQTSVDYLGTREFAMRPRLWPRLLTDLGSTVSFAPPFGYELTARRLRDGDAAAFDLSRWRIAGCGADMIRPEVLEHFAEALAPAGFEAGALMPSYGMAEVSLAVSFTPRRSGLCVDTIDYEAREHDGDARPAASSCRRTARFTRCGVPLPDYEVEIRAPDGSVLPGRREGTVWLRTPSTMVGYLNAPEINERILVDGWLDTGDLGYLAEGQLVLTGRRKDLLIINGRNIWPQDVEHVAEQHAGVRTGDAAAFTVEDHGDAALVLLLQCRETDDDARDTLLRGIRREIQAEFGVEARVAAVAPHSLPRTTSGKLSRSRARSDYLAGTAG
jgi:fatty-acyl-CoA synthase